MKIKLLVLFLLASVIAKAQTNYQLNYDNVRVGKDGNSVTSFRGYLRFPYIGIGSVTDSVLVINGTEVRKVPRSQFSGGSSSVSWGSITGTLSNQSDLNTKFNNYYLNTNPSGYISGITALMVTNALGFTPYNSTNPNGFITSGALTPYLLATTAQSTYYPLNNPNGYISSFTETDPIWSGVADNYRTKSQNDALYYPLTGNPSGFLTTFTELDPTVPTYAKTLTAFSAIKPSTDALYEPIITTKNTAFNVNFGTASGTAAQGNDSRINNGQTAFGWGNHALAGYYSASNPNGYTNNTGTITNITATNNTGQTWTITNPSTTPNLSLSLTSASVGLGNVNNTSDANKPVSTAQQTALDGKQPTLVSGTNIATINGNNLLLGGNIVISGGGGSPDTTIYRTVSNSRSLAQTQTALNLKVDKTTTLTNGYGINSIGDLSANRTISADTTSSNGLVSKSRLTASLQNFNVTNAFTGIGTVASPFDLALVTSARGGTGVNNGSSTITLGGNLTTSGAFATTVTTTAATNVTLPTTGTLYGTATGSITSAQLLASLSNETGTGNAVFSASPTFTGTPLSTTATAKTNTTQIATTAFTPKQFTATGSGTGSATSITVAHGVSGVTSANSVVVTANNAAAGGLIYATLDATNVTIVYSVAPASGTNNLAYSISIR